MRTHRYLAAFALVVAVVLGCGAAQKEHRLRATLLVIDAAREAFVRWDGERQALIVLHATSRDDGKHRLTNHRVARELIVAAFQAAYAAVALAAIEPSDAHEQEVTSSLLSLQTTIVAHGIQWPTGTPAVDAGS
jgi:hypothetical protein